MFTRKYKSEWDDRSLVDKALRPREEKHNPKANVQDKDFNILLDAQRDAKEKTYPFKIVREDV